MQFWHGILIGLAVGSFFGMMTMAVLSINKCEECNGKAL